jgi:hypothetical protein
MKNPNARQIGLGREINGACDSPDPVWNEHGVSPTSGCGAKLRGVADRNEAARRHARDQRNSVYH